MKRLVGWVAFAVLVSAGPVCAADDPTTDLPHNAAMSVAATKEPASRIASAEPASAGALDPFAWPLQEQLPPLPPPITLVLRADLVSQRLTVIENGKEKHVWPISSGAGVYATRTGTFRPQWASRMWRSRQYNLAPMPHAIFFNRGTAFHGTGAVGLLGRPASHGCIRLAPASAARLFTLVHRHGYEQTAIVVHGGPRTKAGPVAGGPSPRRQAASAQAAPRRGGAGGFAIWPF